jgi:hypothetical protein
MKKEYDFSNAEQGKFYRSDARFEVPIYLEPEAYSFVEAIARKRNTEISTVVNELIKTDRDIAEIAQT